MKQTSVFMPVLFLVLLLPGSMTAVGQRVRPDTAYIRLYDSLLTGRFYFSQKYTTVNFRSEDHRLKYLPNTTFNVGIGVTYRSFTLNLAYRAPVLNNDDEKGRTKYLDLQAHIYRRRWVVDFYGQNYRGYYTDAIAYPGVAPAEWYVRPDIRLNLYGLAVYRLTNGNRFSFAAPFMQNEWQFRSAGTWLYGAELHGAVIRADSSFVPRAKENDFSQRNIDNIKWLQAGPGGGYAYTLVVARHFFVTAAATANLHLGLAETRTGDEAHTRFTLSPGFIFRGAAGYNSDRWMVSFTNTPNRLALRNLGWSDPAIFSTGNYRFNIAHRFVPGPRLKRRLRVLDPKH